MQTVRQLSAGGVMLFSMQHIIFKGNPTVFSEANAPDWLTSRSTVCGSTMDHRWFWDDHVLTLQVSQSIDTDFQTITRIK